MPWRNPVVRLEIVFAAAVILVAVTGLVVTRSLREDRAGTPPTSAAPAVFPRAGDLTLAGEIGATLVGLTVRQGRSGSTQVYVYLNPDPGGSADTTLTMAGDARPYELAPCGESCRVATVDRSGDTDLTVDVSGVGTTSFHVPSLPLTRADAIVDRATAAMQALDSYHVDEDLAGTRAAYDFVVPDRLLLRVWYGNGEQDTVWIGSTVYRQESTGGWRTQSGAVAPAIPYFNWVPFQPLVAMAVTGSGELDNVPVTIVSGFAGHGDDPEPVWFTLSVDEASGLVLRSQMWAPGHFMDDRYSGFNQPAEIEAPDIHASGGQP